MNIPDCYDPVRQAERLAFEADKQEARRERCGACCRLLEPGEPVWTLLLKCGAVRLCHRCKQAVDESETTAEEGLA